MGELKPSCCRSRPCKHPGIGPCDMPYVSQETLHDAEDAEALHKNLDREGVPRADDAGAVYSLWGRVLRFVERRSPQPVTPVGGEVAPFAWGVEVDFSGHRPNGRFLFTDKDEACAYFEWRQGSCNKPTLHPLYPHPPVADAALSNAYDVGWIECTNWAKRDDLVSDMDSPAYAEDRARNLAALNQRGGGE